MNIVIKSIVVVVAVIVVAVETIPFFISADDIFATVAQKVEETTERKLIIDGEKSLSLFPSLRVELHDARLTNIAQGTRADMMKIDALEIQIPYLSVLSGSFSLDKFVIRNPDILLERTKDGQVNWQLLPAGNQEKSQGEVSDGDPASLPEGFDINLGEVAIYGGKLSYIDHASGEELTLSDFDLSVRLPTLNEALNISGQLTYKAQTFTIDTRLETPAKLLASQDFALDLSLDSALFNLNYQGAIAQNFQRISGQLSLKGDSVKQILAWHGQPLSAQEEAFNQFSIDTEMVFQDAQLALSSMNLALDKLQITGKTTLNIANKLSIEADVDLGMLDVNPYLPEPTDSPAAPKSDTPQPIVWDNTSLDLSALSTINADIAIRASGFKARNITLGESQLKLNLTDGTALITLDKFEAYEGNGKGSITVNASSKPYAITTEFNFSGIQAKPLLSDVAGFEKLMGKGQLSWRFNTFGDSQKTFISGLKGNLGFGLADGAVQGANLASLVRSVKSILDSGVTKEGLSKGFDGAESTDFSELTGEFSFVDGISSTNNLTMKSPLLRVTGKGTVDLPKTHVNYRLVTGIVSSIEGQGTQDKSTGFKIPVRIKGPFHEVSIKPDMEEAAKDKAKDTIKDKLKDKLKDLF